MAEELKTCPFCGKSDFLIEQLDGCSSVVICQGMVDEHSACLARGPIAIQDDDGEEHPGKDAAIREWNTRAQQPSQGSEAVATVKVVPGTDWKCLDFADGFVLQDQQAGIKLYTHPANAPTDSRVVLVELLERATNFGRPDVMEIALGEIRALLEVNP